VQLYQNKRAIDDKLETIRTNSVRIQFIFC